MLKPADERRLIEAWQNDSDVSARDRIVRAYARLCYRIASGYSSNPEHVDDLAQEGSFGIMRALDKFDLDRGTRFSTYVRRWIQNFIAAATARTVGVVDVPSRAFMDARMGRLAPGANDPAVAATKPAVSIDASVADESGQTVLDRLISSAPTPEDTAQATTSDAAFKSAIDIAMVSLTAREQKVIRERRLIDPPRTLEEIACEFGVSRERVRQIEVASLGKLAAALSRNGFDPERHFRD